MRLVAAATKFIDTPIMQTSEVLVRIMVGELFHCWKALMESDDGGCGKVSAQKKNSAVVRKEQNCSET